MNIYEELINDYVDAIDAVTKKHGYLEMSVLTMANVAMAALPTDAMLYPIEVEKAIEYLYEQLGNIFIAKAKTKFKKEGKTKAHVVTIDYDDVSAKPSKPALRLDRKTKPAAKKKTKPKAKPQTKAKPKAVKKTK